MLASAIKVNSVVYYQVAGVDRKLENDQQQKKTEKYRNTDKNKHKQSPEVTAGKVQSIFHNILKSNLTIL